MKKVAIFLAILILLTSLASAEIIFNQQPKEIYNLGDTISIPVTIKSAGNVNQVLNINLICNGAEINFYKNGISISAGEEKKIDSSLILTSDVIGTMNGDCTAKAILGDAYIISNNFKISSLINLEVKQIKTDFSPGETIIIEGSALKENKEPANGFIDLEMTSGKNNESIIQSETINKGSFKINVLLPKDTATGAYLINLNAYEKDSSEKLTNTGTQSLNVNIKQVPTTLEITFENKEIEPGTNVQIRAILHDQTGEKINSVAIITIKDKKDKIIQQTEKDTDSILEYPVSYNQAPGEWKVHAVSNQLEAESNFKILEKQDVELNLINRTLTITNKGNVHYNKTVSVKIKEQIIEIKTNLDVDESQKYYLTAPNGEYNVEVLTDGQSKINSNVVLTGKVIDVKKAQLGFIEIIRHPLVWAFITAVLGFMAFMVFRKGYKRSFIGRIGIPFKKNQGESSPIPLSKSSLIKTKNKAELSLSLKGDKQNISLLCMKIKNLNEVKSKKGGVEEILQKIVEDAEDAKAVIYENQGNLFFMLVPVKTKTFANEKTALHLSQKIKQILDNHNKLARLKIDFGLSLNYGTIVAKQEKDSMKFMSMGTLINISKRIASVSLGEILLAEKIKEKFMADIKTEKHERDGLVYYMIKEIKDRDASKKFIGDFVRRMERK